MNMNNPNVISGMRIYAEMRIYGDNCDPDKITQDLNLSPSQTWKKGDKAGKSQIIRNYSCWLLKTPEVETFDTNKMFSELMLLIKGHEENIVEYLKINNILSVDIVFVIDSNDMRPELWISRDNLKRISEFKANLWVDIY